MANIRLAPTSTRPNYGHLVGINFFFILHVSIIGFLFDLEFPPMIERCESDY